MKNKEFQLVSNQSLPNKLGLFYNTNKLGDNIYVNSSPTSNCQIYSIGSILSIFNRNQTKEDSLRLIKLIHKAGDKAQVLVDIHQDFESKFEDLFPKESIVFKNKYVNTKYSTPMIIYFCKTQWIYDLLETDRKNEQIKIEEENKKKQSERNKVELPF